MKSTVENLDPARIKLTVEVPYEELKPSLDAAYKEIGSQIQVPGFRRGHVPDQIIDRRVGRATVIQEAVNKKLSDLYRDAIEESGRAPMIQPEVEITELPNVTGAQGGRLVFTAEVTVRPEIDLPELSGAEVVVDAVSRTGPRRSALVFRGQCRAYCRPRRRTRSGSFRPRSPAGRFQTLPSS